MGPVQRWNFQNRCQFSDRVRKSMSTWHEVANEAWILCEIQNEK